MTTTEEFLSHYGVKGMKWGVRKKSGGVSKRAQRKAARQERDQKILKARLHQTVLERKMQEAQAEFFVARGAKQKTKTEAFMRKKQDEYFNGDNAKMAAQATRGEKIAAGVVWSAVTLTAIGIAGSSLKDF